VAKYGERLVQYAIQRPDVRGHSLAAPDPTAFRSGLLPVEHFDRRFSADNLEFWVPVLVREARIDSDTDVLDVGCGTGGFARAIAGATSARVTGCEQAPHFVEFARAAAEDDSVAVTWVVGDAEALPFAASSFDRVLLSLVLHQLSEPRSAVAEAFRTLRPGGLVLVRTIAPEDVPNRVPERFVPSMAAADAARMPALETIREWLERAGFVDVDVRRHLRNKVLELGAQEAALRAEVRGRYGFVTQEEVAEGVRRMRLDASRASGRWVDPRPTYTIVAKRPG
jgi:SAM-dependent methyltransferase